MIAASSQATSRLHRPISAEEAAFVRDLCNATPHNSADLIKHYSFQFLDLPASHRQLLVDLTQFAEKSDLKLFEHIDREFIDSHCSEIKTFVEHHGELSVALLCLLGKAALFGDTLVGDYIEQLEKQGGCTVAHMLAATPLKWINRDSSTLLQLRENFGVAGLPILKQLRERFPEGMCPYLHNLVEQLGIDGFGFLVSATERELITMEKHRETLIRMRDLCLQVHRPDAFSVGTLYLKEALLDTHADKILKLAELNPAKLPDLLVKIRPVYLERHFEILCDIALGVRGRISQAVEALSLISDDETPFTRELIEVSGIFASVAIERRGANLLKANAEHHQQLLAKYGHAFWGLADRFLENLHSEVAAREPFIDQALLYAHSGAGKLFSKLPLELWNEAGLDFARRYQNAAGHIAEQRSEDTLEIEADPHYRYLADENQRHFNIRWFNRYTEYKNGKLDLTLLENNLRNRQENSRDTRPVAVVISAHTDPLNALDSNIHYRMFVELSKHTRLFIAEAGEKQDISRILRDIPRKIDLLILAAHSNGFTLQLSGARHVSPLVSTEAVQSSDQFISSEDGALIDEWNESLSDSCRSLLIACSAFQTTRQQVPIGTFIEQRIRGTMIPGLRRTGGMRDFALNQNLLLEKVFWHDGYAWY